MAAPKLKIHSLPDGYSQVGDKDVQQTNNDELLPYVDKPTLLSDAYPLTGIVHVPTTRCLPFDLGAGRNQFSLTPSSGEFQTPIGIGMTDILIGPTGDLELRVLRADNSPIPPYDPAAPLPASGWRVNYSGDAPTSIEFLSNYPMGAKISCWNLHSLPHTQWALPHDQAYGGANPTFNKVYTSRDSGGVYPAAASGDNASYLVTPAASGVTAEYWYENRYAKQFCGEHNNWIGGHYEMWPDVFVGRKNYPGDSVIDPITQVPIDPGYVPQFRAIGTYQIAFRDGLVTFPEVIDQQAVDINAVPQGEVKASYAYLKNIGNVTAQVLDAVGGSGGLTFKAQGETKYPESHGKRWVSRFDDYIPQTVYVNGVVTPTPIVNAGDILSVKTS